MKVLCSIYGISIRHSDVWIGQLKFRLNNFTFLVSSKIIITNVVQDCISWWYLRENKKAKHFCLQMASYSKR